MLVACKFLLTSSFLMISSDRGVFRRTKDNTKGDDCAIYGSVATTFNSGISNIPCSRVPESSAASSKWYGNRQVLIINQ